jgi:hypothetical protein
VAGLTRQVTVTPREERQQCRHQFLTELGEEVNAGEELSKRRYRFSEIQRLVISSHSACKTGAMRPK